MIAHMGDASCLGIIKINVYCILTRKCMPSVDMREGRTSLQEAGNPVPMIRDKDEYRAPQRLQSWSKSQPCLENHFYACLN